MSQLIVTFFKGTALSSGFSGGKITDRNSYHLNHMMSGRSMSYLTCKCVSRKSDLIRI